MFFRVHSQSIHRIGPSYDGFSLGHSPNTCWKAGHSYTDEDSITNDNPVVFLKAPSLFPCLSPSSDCVDRGFSEDKMEEIEKGSKGVSEERWKGAVVNLTEMTSNLDSLQKLLLKKAVFVDDETFSKASLTSEQSRTIKVLIWD